MELEEERGAVIRKRRESEHWPVVARVVTRRSSLAVKKKIQSKKNFSNCVNHRKVIL